MGWVQIDDLLERDRQREIALDWRPPKDTGFTEIEHYHDVIFRSRPAILTTPVPPDVPRVWLAECSCGWRSRSGKAWISEARARASARGHLTAMGEEDFTL